MRKKIGVFFLVLMLCAAVLVGITQTGKADGGTQVSGILTDNETWTTANSPYTLSGAVGVPACLTLTVEAGVVVNIGSYYIDVNGTLSAKGNNTNPIQLNGGEIRFTQLCENWSETTATGCIIENAQITSNLRIQSCSVKINANEFSNGFLSISGGSASLVSNNVFVISNRGSGTALSISDSNASITSNMFAGGYSPLSISSGCPLVENNLIAAGYFGINMRSTFNAQPLSPTIRNNTITGNIGGIYFENMGGSATTPTIVYNNIYDNDLNVDLSGSGIYGLRSNITATYNWWGTTDQQEIEQTIYDHTNDYNLGVVEFEPFLIEANPQAPVLPTFTIQASAGQGGTITPSGTVVVDYGDTPEFTITPNSGYKLGTVIVDGNPTTSYTYQFPMGSSNTVYYTFEPVIANGHTIQASFEPEASTSTQSPTNNPTENSSDTPITPEIPTVTVLLLFMIPITLAMVLLRKNPKIRSY